MPRYALITGASSGIGLAIAEALARRGRNLILVARQRDALESIAYELTQRFGVEVLFSSCDLSEPLQLSGLLQELELADQQIDLLVNNAGFGTAGHHLAPVAQISFLQGDGQHEAGGLRRRWYADLRQFIRALVARSAAMPAPPAPPADPDMARLEAELPEAARLLKKIAEKVNPKKG